GEIRWRGEQGLWGTHREERRPIPLRRYLGDAANEEVYCELRYQGQLFDAETGLYYNRHRYFDPETAQYLSADPIGLLGGLRPQGYVHNPLEWVDPLGLTPKEGKTKGSGTIHELDPKDIRFSQSSVNGAADLTESMKNNGWAGDPIDVVRMSDGKLTTIDNTRVLAASRAGVNVKARIHEASDALPSDFVERFTTKKGTPSSWEEAINLRIGKQSAGYRNQYPSGSPVIGTMD
ncbi:RHS repeat-associated core domain-containing protein, partial [Pectobacterium aquaticum]|uniref:RHS repeat-associated core domain-containing protein n=1 Tax=Pectobacterium aquaticum TaxID=2204145 RepID=UPI001D013BAE